MNTQFTLPSMSKLESTVISEPAERSPSMSQTVSARGAGFDHVRHDGEIEDIDDMVVDSEEHGADESTSEDDSDENAEDVNGIEGEEDFIPFRVGRYKAVPGNARFDQATRLPLHLIDRRSGSAVKVCKPHFEVSWDSRTDIKRLNAWYRRCWCKLGGRQLQLPHLPWSEEELDFLRDVFQKNKGITHNEARQRFNDHFRGRTLTCRGQTWKFKERHEKIFSGAIFRFKIKRGDTRGKLSGDLWSEEEREFVRELCMEKLSYDRILKRYNKHFDGRTFDIDGKAWKFRPRTMSSLISAVHRHKLDGRDERVWYFWSEEEVEFVRELCKESSDYAAILKRFNKHFEGRTFESDGKSWEFRPRTLGSLHMTVRRLNLDGRDGQNLEDQNEQNLNAKNRQAWNPWTQEEREFVQDLFRTNLGYQAVRKHYNEHFKGRALQDNGEVWTFKLCSLKNFAHAVLYYRLRDRLSSDLPNLDDRAELLTEEEKEFLRKQGCL
ncbi:uncharacterized protein K452DRAFT_302353 [Aplosporella prunicola CBS 121167]|uniref:Uncharacterized protein n=1 Tax=Aplosporella prunicola CBS 121167 TaxID=1176127 RepID=A0A6A6B084_9PEZI|nr:uncharacterized protein K452DRAFT_302353 [Aplosporella prunicola CBS 121167]KAF2136958.1 hypothetical protein K452DRAFT_302353 [Aplosporella prunicola CBS 121167]